MSDEAGEFWGVLELLGHVRTAGKVSQVEMFGTKMGRIDVPKGDAFVTQFFSGGSVYRLTPCGEAEARAVAASNQPQPVHPWEMPRGLPGAAREEHAMPDGVRTGEVRDGLYVEEEEEEDDDDERPF